ncbi:putative reverse transcriptase domain-containing protein [Tanacetum coccineum]
MIKIFGRCVEAKTEVDATSLPRRPTAGVERIAPAGTDVRLYCTEPRSNYGVHVSQEVYGASLAHILEYLTVVFSLKLWRYYLYGTKCTVFTDHMSLQHILNQKELNMRQRRWLELLSDYDCEIRYHPWKATVVVDALSKKEREPPLRVQALVML